MNDSRTWNIRDAIIDIAKKMSNRVRVAEGEIEIDMGGVRTSSSIRMKVIKANTRKTLMKVVHSGYDMNGEYFTRDTEMYLPTADVNKLFYSI